MEATEKVHCLIIGSGPAGYTAAIYASRAGLNPVLYQGIQHGGQLTITTEVENYPGYPEGIQGPEMMVHFEKQAARMGADIRYGLATKVDFTGPVHKVQIDEEKWIEADTVINFTGASAKWQGLESEQRLNGFGVSPCAVSDGFFFKGKEVAIVGAGDTAAEEAFHADSAAALVVDGQLINAVEEERFRRIKHWAGFPSPAIDWCLTSAGLDLGKVNIVAINTDPRAGRMARTAYTIRHLPSPAMVIDRLRARRKRLSIDQHFAREFPTHDFRATVVPVEHHLAHLASAYYPSGFDRAVALSVDGFGDFASAAWGIGANGRLAVDGKVGFPHSLGVFYQALTQFLGFPHYGDEYKVMGLAPYGKPTFADLLRKVSAPQEGQVGTNQTTPFAGSVPHSEYPQIKRNLSNRIWTAHDPARKIARFGLERGSPPAPCANMTGEIYL